MIRDILPTNVEYVAGSTYVFNSNHQEGVNIKSQDTITTSGLNIGTYTPRAQGYVQFTGKVVDKTLACGSNQLVNWANVTTNGAVSGKDDASVMVDKECDEPDNPDNPDNPEPEPEPEPEPTPTPAPTPSETPTTIVSTGPETVVTGALGAGSTVTTLGYYLSSRRKLK